MTSSVHIAAAEGLTGKSTVALGVLAQISQVVERPRDDGDRDEEWEIAGHGLEVIG
jgi:hypothetical protein